MTFYVNGNLLTPEGAGRGFNLGVGLTEPVATVTLWPCLVNTACAILSVFISTHFVSCTIQCEETGFHFLSAQEKRLFTLLLLDFMSHNMQTGDFFLAWQSVFSACDAGISYLINLSFCSFVSANLTPEYLFSPRQRKNSIKLFYLSKIESLNIWKIVIHFIMCSIFDT